MKVDHVSMTKARMDELDSDWLRRGTLISILKCRENVVKKNLISLYFVLFRFISDSANVLIS